VVVTLDLEGDRLALAEVDDARVLARPLEDARRGSREAAEEGGGVLVRAVLRPEEREDRELEVIRLSTEQLSDSVELPIGQPEGAVERLFRYRRQGCESSGGAG
jgi:hypothetical protein